MSGWLGALQVAGPIIGDALGFLSSNKSSKAAAKFNMAQLQFQKDMAHNQIQWRTADAKAAGLHPLFALGASPYSASPIPVSGDGGGGEFLSNMGQNISRAVGAGMTARQREKEAAALAAQNTMERKRQDILFRQQIENNELQNTFLAARIALLKQPGTGPGQPEVRDVGPGVVAVNPARTTSPDPVNTGREAGAIRDYGFVSTDAGGLAVVPSYDVHERIEDNFPQQLGWALRNQIVPFFGGLEPPSRSQFPLPRGATRWKWDPLWQQFRPWHDYEGRPGGYWVRGDARAAVGEPRRR